MKLFDKIFKRTEDKKYLNEEEIKQRNKDFIIKFEQVLKIASYVTRLIIKNGFVKNAVRLMNMVGPILVFMLKDKN